MELHFPPLILFSRYFPCLFLKIPLFLCLSLSPGISIPSKWVFSNSPEILISYTKVTSQDHHYLISHLSSINHNYRSDYLKFPINNPLLQQQPQPTSDRNPNFNKISRRWHIGHHHQHVSGGGDDKNSSKEGEKVFKLGLAADISLATGKALTGYLSGSTAIIADAAHSISDVVLNSIALVSYRLGRAPKDKEHPYGYS